MDKIRKLTIDILLGNSNEFIDSFKEKFQTLIKKESVYNGYGTAYVYTNKERCYLHLIPTDIPNKYTIYCNRAMYTREILDNNDTNQVVNITKILIAIFLSVEFTYVYMI